MRIRFWGVRGTIPSPGPDTVEIGANTPCIDILTSDQQLIILDAGTGIRQLGKQLTQEFPDRIVGTILMSHTHWDHIQGLPFFAPLDCERNRFVIIGQKHLHQELEQIIAGQISEPYLPFAYKQLAADILVKEVDSGEYLVVGDATVVETAVLQHPGDSLGFRIENNGVTIAYITDTSHPKNGLNENVLKLAQNADLLIHEAAFTPEEVTQRPTWGHSSWEQAAHVAKKANAKQLALCHFSPEHSDSFLKETVLKSAREIFPNTILGTEGLGLEFSHNLHCFSEGSRLK